MSGHSRWSNIKHKKGKTDAMRAKVFTKIGREIAVAVKSGGSDPALNSKLFEIIAKAKIANMPNDNIDRSIKKASGELSSVNYESIIYEGYGAGGSAVIVEALTDNKNRTAGEVRCAFEKNGGSMGTTNCVSYMFDRKGIIVCERNSLTEDKILEISLEAGAEDVAIEDDFFEVFTSPSEISSVKKILEEKKLSFLSAEVEWFPQSSIEINEEHMVKFQKMIDMLEDSDDVQNVYHNVSVEE